MREKTIDTIRLEGPLFVHNVLVALFADKDNRSSPAYPLALPPGTRLNDEIGRAFSIASAAWRTFRAQREAHPQAAIRRFLGDFFSALGYAADPAAKTDLSFRFPLLAPAFPVFFKPYPQEPADSLDTPARRFSGDGIPERRRSLSQFVQQWLNLHDEALWALATDACTIRLFRDNGSLTRPAFLEFDLGRILDEGRYADFACLFYILHDSRVGPSADASASLWETLRTKGAEEGVRVFEALRDGVVRALVHLGNGFLAAPSIRSAFASGALDDASFFGQLLHTAYRFLFLFAAEERDALHAPAAAPAAARVYDSGYSMRRLADRCRRAASRDSHIDLWEGVRIVFRSLATGEPRLALPALGGLFRADQAPDIDAAPLSNRALLEAIRALRWTQSGGAAQRVDYRNLGAEELGSVYESLLELVPSVSRSDWRFSFVGIPDPLSPAAPARGRRSAVAGNSRKTSGSYYTPSSLVDQLVRSVIDPLLDTRLKGLTTPADRETALLSLSVLDPACGSGHFLLAAARRIAERLAQVRSGDDEALTPAVFQNALRDVVSRCIYGTDLNPLALELAKTALWLETLVPGQPLSFLDAHFACGNAVLGVLDLKTLQNGIPDDAFSPLSGDERAACAALKRLNRDTLRHRQRDIRQGKQQLSLLDPGDLQNTLSDRYSELDAMPEDTLPQIEAKRAAHEDFLRQASSGPLAAAANLYVSAFLLPKTAPAAPSAEPSLFPLESSSPSGPGGPVPPTSADLFATLHLPGFPAPEPATLQAAKTASSTARVLHWPLVFPAVFAKGGFDAILGNPPWDRIKLQEQEFFATRAPAIADAPNAAARKRLIEALATSAIPAEQALYNAFTSARRFAEATSTFVHDSSSQQARFPLSGTGDVNLYALFAELATQILNPNGRAGLVLPSGIASDDSTKTLFRSFVDSNRLESLLSFENEELTLFPAVHHSFKFALVTLGRAPSADFAFFLRNLSQLTDARRHFTLAPSDFALLNPNTRTCPVFRSTRDAELAKSIYRRVPPLLLDAPSESGPGGAVRPPNPWHIRLWSMFHMTNDSPLFQTAPAPGLLPLYEAKMIDQFDHRYNAFDTPGQETFHACTPEEKADPAFEPAPRYWLPASQVLAAANQSPAGAVPSAPPYIFGWRDVTNAATIRSTIATVIPLTAVGNTLCLFYTPEPAPLQACLLTDFNSLVRDWLARQKIGGLHLNFFTMKQLPTLPPSAYTPDDIDYIVPRVLELTYTSHSLTPWARALGHDGPPFPWDENRRALLRAELDARYARLYGLTRDELLYILDPKAATNDPTFPSESFRVLRDSELSAYGEYRTQRMVLDAWDAQERPAVLADNYTRAQTWDDSRATYLRFLVGQMIAQSSTHQMPLTELFTAFSALRTPKELSRMAGMPKGAAKWAREYKDAIRDDESLESVLMQMFEAGDISISKSGIVSYVDEGSLHAADHLMDVVTDARMALAFLKLDFTQARVEHARRTINPVFFRQVMEGAYARAA